MDNKTDEEIVLDKYWPEFVYPKDDIGPDDERYCLAVDYDRLRHLIKEHPQAAFELAAATGYVDMNTGLIKESYVQDNVEDYVEWEILEVVELVSTFGLSGSIEPYFLSLLDSTLRRKPIASLTGNDWEWVDVTEVSSSETELYQNRRLSSVFKDENHAWWIDGKIFSNNGDDWYTNKNSNVDVEFPCQAGKLKSEYIRLDVEE